MISQLIPGYDDAFGPNTPENAIAMKRAFENAACNPMSQVQDKDGNRIGRPILMGTSSSNEDDFNQLRDMFLNPNNYK